MSTTYHLPRRAVAMTATLASFCALAPAAGATLVSRPQGEQGPVLNIEDQAAVKDALTVSGSNAAGARVESINGTPIIAGLNCAQSSATVVTCQPGAQAMFALLAGGDDKLTDTSTFTSTIVGGDGNDTLVSASSTAHSADISGQAGNDTLDLSGNPGPDVARGGAGVDTVTYEGRPRTGVVISLDHAANDGALPIGQFALGSSEGDNIDGDVETLVGTRVADRISGGAGNQTLLGGGGNDTLNGLGDNDVLLGGPGNDTELGGDGDDTLGRAGNAAPSDF